MFRCEYYDIFKINYLEEHPQAVASESKTLKLFIHNLMKL